MKIDSNKATRHRARLLKFFLKNKLLFKKKKSLLTVCYRFFKKSESKNNLKIASNEKLLRAASQKIDFF